MQPVQQQIKSCLGISITNAVRYSHYAVWQTVDALRQTSCILPLKGEALRGER
jgi:hypothetical protein